MKLILTTEGMTSAIASISRRGKVLDNDIHIMAVSAALHVAKDGDCTYVNALLAGLPKGSRSVAVAAWFDEFAPVEYDDENSLFKTDKVNAKAMKAELNDETDLPLSLRAGVEKSWVECKPEMPYKSMNLRTLLKKACTEAQKRLDAAIKDGDKGDTIDIKLLAGVKALVETESAS